MAYTNPSVSDFKSYFVRDFTYGATVATVMDQDIQNAMAITNPSINQNLFAIQADFTAGYLLLSAHNLCINLRAGAQGQNGQFNWGQAGKSVGNVSESFSIPQRILDNPEFAYLTKTNYGVQYLMMILPQLSGQIYTVAGGTNF